MRERDLFSKSEMGNLEALLKLAGEIAKKTATATFKGAKEYPVTSLSLGVEMGTLGLVVAGGPSWLVWPAWGSTLTAYFGLMLEVAPMSQGRNRVNLPKAIGRGIGSAREWWSAYKRNAS